MPSAVPQTVPYGLPTKPAAIEIRIANVDLPAKLDALGAAVAAVREGHRDTMSPRAWAAMHRAQEALAEAILYANERPALPIALRNDSQKAH